MQRKRLSAARRGFTHTELVVVLGITALLAVLIPQVVRHYKMKDVSTTLDNGRAIWRAIDFEYTQPLWGAEMPYEPAEWVGWPFSGPTNVTNNQYATSTDFFTDIVTNGLLPVSFSFFAPAGVPPARGDFTQFQATNNGWCIVGDVGYRYPKTAPILFTKNLSGLLRMDVPIPAHMDGVASDFMPWDARAPFSGRGAFVFITRSGAGFGLHGELLKYASFTNLFQQADAAGNLLTNTVIRP